MGVSSGNECKITELHRLPVDMFENDECLIEKWTRVTDYNDEASVSSTSAMERHLINLPLAKSSTDNNDPIWLIDLILGIF